MNYILKQFKCVVWQYDELLFINQVCLWMDLFIEKNLIFIDLYISNVASFISFTKTVQNTWKKSDTINVIG